jgi:hypothetical protein
MVTRSVPDGDINWGADIRALITRKNELTDDVTNRVPTTVLGSGTASSSNFLRGDGSWSAPATGIPTTTVTTKGDLIVATASGTVTRRGVGADGTVLTAASGQTDGVAWSTISIPTGSVVDASVSASAAISADKFTDGTTNKIMTATERTKLSAIGVVRSVSASAGTISIDANTAGNNIDTTLSADATLNVPTNGVAGQTLQGSVLASAAQRILTFNASYGRLTGITATLTIPSGKVGRYAIRRTDITGSAKWLVEAAAVEQ